MKRPVLRLILGLILLAILAGGFGYCMLVVNVTTMVRRDEVDAELKAKAVSDSLLDMAGIADRVDESLLQMKKTEVSTRAAVIGLESSEDESLLQPQYYGDGLIFRDVGDSRQAEMPEGFPEDITPYGRDILEDSGALLLRYDEDPDTGKLSTLMLYYARLYDDLYYAEWGENWRYTDEGKKYFDSTVYMKGIEESFNASVIVINGAYSEGGYESGYVSYASDELPQRERPAMYGLTDELLEAAVEAAGDPDHVESVTIEKDIYDITAYELTKRNQLVCLLSPFSKNYKLAREEALMVCFVFAGLGIVFAVWIFLVLRVVRDHGLTEEQKLPFMPRRIRSRAAVFVLVSVLLLSIVSLFLGCLFGLHSHTVTVDRALSVLSDQMAMNEERQKVLEKSRDDLYLAQVNLLREILISYPELAERGGLEAINEVIGADYIILYDTNGKEMSCSKPLYNLKIGTGEDSATYPLRKLLHGVDSVSIPAAVDEVTGLKRALYGVSYRPGTWENIEGCGVLAIAVDPNEMMLVNQENTNSIMRMLVTDEMVCFSVDPESGRVLNASNSSLVGKDAAVLGFPEEAKRDGYRGFFRFAGRPRYASVEEKDGVFYVYAADQADVYNGVFTQAACAAEASLVCYLILAVFMLLGYRRGFEKYSDVGKELEEDDLTNAPSSGKWKKFSVDPSKRWGFAKVKYGTRGPAHYAFMTLEILFIIGTCVMGLRLLARRTSGTVQTSVLSYMMSGQWARGMNLFALSNIIFLMCQIGMIVILSRFFLQILGGVFGTKGETVCRLLLNMVSYAGVIVFIFMSMSYVGIDTATLLASLGLATFALSLGLKDLVTDVVAGIFIVFEGEYQVGDIIDIAGYRGTVIEIGVRTTKLEGRGGNIKIIANRDVKNVVNMTRKNSWYAAELNVSSEMSVIKLGEIFKGELPEIGKKIPEIISGPMYRGVIGFGRGTMTISIVAECNEMDYFAVQRKLNGELQELCERNGIKLL